MKAPTERQVTDRFSAAWPSIEPMVGAVFDKEAALSFSSVVARASLPRTGKLNGAMREALWDGVAHLIGQTPGRAELRSNLSRLLANWNFIAEGMHVPLWDGKATTSDAVFIGVSKAKTKPGERQKYLVKTKLKTGVCAGIIQCVPLNDNQIYNFLDKVSGTRKYNCSAEEIAGMRARLDVEVMGEDLLIRHMACTENQRKSNKQIAEARSDLRKCARCMPCNACTRTVLDCPLAVWLPTQGD